MNTIIKQERLSAVKELYAGQHTPDSKMCLLEAVAYVAGESWSDSPQCVSPVLAAFGRGWNDGMRSNKEREQLRQYIPLLINTVSTQEVESRRSYMAADWIIRTHLPTWLRLAGLSAKADALASLPPIVNKSDVVAARPFIETAEAAAWTAARDTTAGAAGFTDPAGAAAWAAGAAGAAPWYTPWDTPWDTPWATARVAAGAALEPTVKVLQESAHVLYRRMIEAKP